MVQRIALTGKHAVGEHAYAIVDDETFAHLSRWCWKAKPNGGGNNIYAVRNTRIDGRHVTIRMHREVLGLGRDVKVEPDHINHNGLDNRKGNLRIVNRSTNIESARSKSVAVLCGRCGVIVAREVSAVVASVTYCSQACAVAASNSRRAPYSSVYFRQCVLCGAPFVGRDNRMIYCSASCRYEKRRARDRETRVLP